MKHIGLYSHLFQVLKGELLSSGFSTDGSIISASAVPHCGQEMRIQIVFDLSGNSKLHLSDDSLATGMEPATW